MVNFNIPVEKIENDIKRYYKFTIEKGASPKSAWLASIVVTNREGKTVQVMAEAFSSLAPAKRWSADQVDRSRLPWVETAEKALTATHEVKVR